MDINTIIDSVVKLPPTPQILPKLQKLLRDENSSIHDIISLLKVDAPMTAQIVRMSNSAYYGATSPSQSLEEAVNRLGFNEVYKVVSMAAANQVLGAEAPVYGLEKGEILDTSIACAIMMVESSARRLRCDLDSVYTLGLLHSIGKVVINQYYIKHGLEIYDPENDETLDLAMEKKLLGFDHAQAGAALLKKWNFPEEIYKPIELQFSPMEMETQKDVTCMLYISRWAAPIVRDYTNPEIKPYDDQEEILTSTGMSSEDLEECIQNARQGFEEVKGMIE